MATSSGAGDLANLLLPALVAGKDFTFPTIDLSGPDYQIPAVDPNDPINLPVAKMSNDDLTTRVVDGTGTFDVLMTSTKAHLMEEYSKGRITGNDYTKAYIELTAAVMSNATQFLLQKDQAYWQAIMVQQQAKRAVVELITARVQLATAKAQYALAHIQSVTAEAEYGLTKIKLATEDASYAGVVAQTAQTVYQTTQLLPAQLAQTKYQTEQLFPAQLLMTNEQVEAARAQTLDERRDGQTIVGSIGKQKDLYDQQIDSYKRDSEMKAAKLYTDAWITMKTIDEGLLPPEAFKNAKIDIIMNHIQANNGLA